MATEFDLSQFTLRRAVFEIRYNEAYILWDRTGQLWEAAINKWPNLKIVDANPAKQLFKLNDTYELNVELSKAHFSDTKPSSSLKNFIEFSESFLNLVTQTLNISEFTRLGFRLIYINDFPDKISAANSMLDTKMIKIPEGKHFNITGKVLLPVYSLRWEGESKGVKVVFRAQDKKIGFEAPLGFNEVPSMHLEKYELVYDIDYYTLAPIVKGQLKISEWLSEAYHLVKRDSKVFMGG